MAPRTTYANLQDGLQNLSLWDASLADMGNLGVIPCTASGTNAITLTPIPSVFAPNVTSPQTNQQFSFSPVANSTGSVTITIGSFTGNLYLENGATQAGSGSLTLGVTYVISRNSTASVNPAGFQILAPANNLVSPIITGATISASTITTSTYNGNTWTTGTGILTIAALKTLTANSTLTLGGVDGKTLTVNNSLTLAGTDATVMTFPTTNATIARTDAGQTFTGTNAF